VKTPKSITQIARNSANKAIKLFNSKSIILSNPYFYYKHKDQEKGSDYKHFKRLFSIAPPLRPIYCLSIWTIDLISTISKTSRLIFLGYTTKAGSASPAKSENRSNKTDKLHERDEGRLLLLSHLNHESDIYTEDDFYYPGLIKAAQKRLRTQILYTNKPNIPIERTAILSRSRGCQCTLIPNNLGAKEELKIILATIKANFFNISKSLKFLLAGELTQDIFYYLIMSFSHSRSCLANQRYLNYFKRVSSNFSNKEHTFVSFLFEGNSWEAMLICALQNSRNTSIIPFIHNMPNTSFNPINPLLNTSLMPSKILISHPSTSSFYGNKVFNYRCVGIPSISRSLRCKDPAGIESDSGSQTDNSNFIFFAPDGELDKVIEMFWLANKISIKHGITTTLSIHPLIYKKFKRYQESNPFEGNVKDIKGPCSIETIKNHKYFVYETSTYALVAHYLGLRIARKTCIANDESSIFYLDNIIPSLVFKNFESLSNIITRDLSASPIARSKEALQGFDAQIFLDTLFKQ